MSILGLGEEEVVMDWRKWGRRRGKRMSLRRGTSGAAPGAGEAWQAICDEQEGHELDQGRTPMDTHNSSVVNKGQNLG